MSGDELSGEVVHTPDEDQTYRIVLRRGGRVTSYIGAATKQNGEAILANALANVKLAGKR